MAHARAMKTELILLPALKAYMAGSGRLVITQKYQDGAAEYAKTWPGRVVSLFEMTTDRSSDLDHLEVGPNEAGHFVEIRPSDTEALAARLESAALVVGFLSPFEVETTKLCNRLGIPIVHVSEYTRRTEWQIIDAGNANPFLKLRRKLWVWQAERTRRKLIGYCAGLQCNGTPTFDAYKNLCPETMLYFDNRVRRKDVIDDNGLAQKAARLRSGRPLRLVFGGRFVPMKGVLQLPEIARNLRWHGISFEFSIHGAGPDEGAMRKKIRQYGLEDQVRISPPVDFRSGWVPFLKQEADLFVCSHLQGDPSSTYPEVMSCGVPIAGYDNEAFKGIAALSGSGFLSPMGKPEKLAEAIASLDKNRALLQEAARAGRDFAQEHCFETSFNARTEHFKRLSRLSPQ